MLAIFKREFKSYFISMIGYAFIAFLLLVIGLCYYWINLHSANAFIGYSLQYSYVIVVFMILVPVVTMKIFADERRLKTDQLLMTAPISVFQIVMGKFLAILCVFLIPMAVICFYPLMLLKFGEVPLGMSYVSILGFFLMGLSYLAIGMFVSSLTESQILSAVITFAILLLSFMVDSLVTIIPAVPLVSLIACLVFGVAAGFIASALMQNRKAGLMIGGLLEVGFILLYVVRQSVYKELIQTVLAHLSLNGYYENFTGGIFDLSAVVYYITVILLFLFLTVQSVQKRRWS